MAFAKEIGELLYTAAGPRNSLTKPFAAILLFLLTFPAVSEYLAQADLKVFTIATLIDDVSNQRHAPFAAKLQGRNYGKVKRSAHKNVKTSAV